MEKQKIVTYAGSIIMSVLLLLMIMASVSGSKSKKNLNAEKLVSEKLLSEKLSVEKELARMQADFSALRMKSEANQKLLAETDMKIVENERRINLLSAENRSLRSSKELEELKKIKASLEQESSKLKSDYEKLLSEHRSLRNSAEVLESEKKNLISTLENIRNINTDNFLVTATRGKKSERIVVKASRAKKLNMNFEIPQNIADAISFKILTPSGATINPDDKALTWSTVDSPNFTASLSAGTGEFVQSRQVMLNYMPKEKLAKGEYKIQVFTDGNIIGNCRIILK